MRGGRRWGCPEPVQVQTCDVGFPRRLRRGSPAFFGRKPEERTPGRREVLSALDPPLSGWWPERGFFFCKTGLRPILPTPVTARHRLGGLGKAGILGPAALGSQNWGMHPEPRQRSWHSRGEQCFLPGTWPRPPSLGLRPIHLVSVQKQITFHSGPCEGRKSATLLSYPNLLPQNANPNQGTQMGTVIAPPPKQCGTTAKTSEWERAGHLYVYLLVLPRDSLRPGFLLEKAWIPRPGPGGKPRCRVYPATVPA